MIEWKRRAPETAHLLNPAFCSIILYQAVFEYEKKARTPFPYTLAYLVLPMVLHKNTRERILSRTNMVVWLQTNSDVLIGFAQRAKSLVAYSNEALEFLQLHGIVAFVDEGLSLVKIISKTKQEHFAAMDQEIAECILKARHVGRWFAQMKTVESVYAAWGVKP